MSLSKLRVSKIKALVHIKLVTSLSFGRQQKMLAYPTLEGATYHKVSRIP